MFKDKTYTFKIEISEKDLVKSFFYKDFIHKCIAAKKKISSIIVSKYLALYNIKKNNEKSEEYLIISNIKNDTTVRFSNDKSFNFNDEFSYTNNIIWNLFSFLHKELEGIWKNTEPLKREKLIISVIYDNINQLDNSKRLTKYNKCVLTGFIIWKFGFILSGKLMPSQLKGKQPTNHSLYESIKYYVKPPKQKNND